MTDITAIKNKFSSKLGSVYDLFKDEMYSLLQTEMEKAAEQGLSETRVNLEKYVGKGENRKEEQKGGNKNDSSCQEDNSTCPIDDLIGKLEHLKKTIESIDYTWVDYFSNRIYKDMKKLGIEAEMDFDDVMLSGWA